VHLAGCRKDRINPAIVNHEKDVTLFCCLLQWCQLIITVFLNFEFQTSAETLPIPNSEYITLPFCYCNNNNIIIIKESTEK